jgi:hypothetical protein
MGCSKTLSEKDVGCRSTVKPCNPVVLLQLSTNAKARECFCNENGCNNYFNQFKTIVGGYFVVMLGTIGTIGNCLTLGVLLRMKEKKDIDIILIGKKLRRAINCNFLTFSNERLIQKFLFMATISVQVCKSMP